MNDHRRPRTSMVKSNAECASVGCSTTYHREARLTASPQFSYLTPIEQLSRAEWELMRICWKLGRASVRQILDESLKQRPRDYRTVQDTP